MVKKIERLVVDYSMEAERKPFGSPEGVADVGEAVEAVEKHIESRPYVQSGDCIQFLQMKVIAGGRESRAWGGRWGCRRGLRGLLLGGYPLRLDLVQMLLVVHDHVVETRRH